MAERDEWVDGAGREDIALHVNPLKADDKILFHVYAAGLSLCQRDFVLNRQSSVVCGVEYVLKGSGEITASGRTYDLAPGDAYILHFYENHSYRTGDCECWRKIWFLFGHAFITAAMRHLGLLSVSRVRLPAEERPAMETHFLRILSCLRDKPKDYQIRSSVLAYEVLLLLAQYADRQAHVEIMPPQVARAVHYVDEHMHEPLSVECIADNAFCSRIHLTRLFKKYFGVSTHEWLASTRMRYACVLLSQTDLPIKDIASRVGYQDPFHFSTAFKKTIQSTPSQYRSQSREMSRESGARRMHA